MQFNSVAHIHRVLATQGIPCQCLQLRFQYDAYLQTPRKGHVAGHTCRGCSMVEQPTSAQIRAVANLCNINIRIYFFRGRQMGLRKNASEIIFF